MELHSIEMLEELEDMIENGKKSLMSGRVSVDKNELLAVIDELKSILPDEIIQANEYYKDSRELRDSAEHEADTIIAQANKEADEIVDKAQNDAEAIIADANSEADAIVKEAHRQQAELISIESPSWQRSRETKSSARQMSAPMKSSAPRKNTWTIS